MFCWCFSLLFFDQTCDIHIYINTNRVEQFVAIYSIKCFPHVKWVFLKYSMHMNFNVNVLLLLNCWMYTSFFFVGCALNCPKRFDYRRCYWFWFSYMVCYFMCGMRGTIDTLGFIQRSLFEYHFFAISFFFPFLSLLDVCIRGEWHLIWQVRADHRPE